MARVFEMAFELAGRLDSSFRNSFQSANNTMSRTRQEIRSLRNMQRSARTELSNGTISQQSYSASMARMQAQTERLTSVQSRMVAVQNMQNEASAGRSKYGAMAMGAAGAGVALFAPAIASSIQFESAMADVKKVVDFDTPDQFKVMSQDIVALSQKIPIATEGLAAIVAAGGQSGIARGELLPFAESAAKMGVAFDISAGEAGDMMAKWRTAFKMNQEEVVGLADKINYLGNTTAASAPKISDVVRRIGPLGEIGGVASGEIAALGASMVGAGIESEVAATGIKNMILGLVAGGGATKTQIGAFAQLGLDATEMAQRMQTDAKGAIIDVLTKIQSLEKYEQANILKSLFGSESLSAISPLLSNLDALQVNFNKVADAANYTGSMEGEFAARSATTSNAIQLATNSVNAAAITLGSIFLPTISEGAGKISALASELATWAQQNPETASSLTKIVAGTIILVGSIGVLGWTYNFLKGNVAGAIGTITNLHRWLFVTQSATTGLTRVQAISAMVTNGLTIAQGALNSTMYGFPVVWIVAGIIAVIAAGYLLYKNWDKVTEFIGTAWDTGVNYISEKWSATVNGFYSGCDYVKEKWNSVTTFIGTAWDSTVSGFYNGLVTIKEGAIWAFTGYIDFWIKLPGRIAYGIGYTIGVLSTLPGKAKVFFLELYTDVSTWTIQTVNDVGILVAQLPERIWNIGRSIIVATVGWTKETYNTTISWIYATVNDVGIWLLQLPNKAVEAGALLVVSTTSWGQGVYTTAVNWLQLTANELSMVLLSIPEKSIEAGITFIDSVNNWASGAYDTVANWVNQIPNLVSTAISSSGQSISGFWNTIASGFNVGKESGGGELPGHADGGIFNKPHIAWFAEGGSAESAIPINNSNRSRNLLAKTNELMGNPLGMSGSGIYAPFSPVITISSSTTNLQEELNKALSSLMDEWENRIRTIQENQRRVAF